MYSKILLSLLVIMVSLPSFATRAIVYDNDDTASQLRLDLIRRENSTIRGNFYIFKGVTGLIHAALLRDALRRGVKVKIITDWQGSKKDKALISHLVHEGAEFGMYHRFYIGNLSIKRLLRRMHDKLMIFGDDKLLVGDRNTGDPYFNMQKKNLFVSRELYLEDYEQSLKAIDYFDRLMASKEVDKYSRYLKPTHKKVKAISEKLDEILLDLKNGTIYRHIRKSSVGNKFRNVRWNSEIDWSSMTTELGSAKFVHDPVGKKGKVPGSEKDIIELVKSAKSSVIFENPYVVMTPSFLNAINAAINRGVEITLITNSYEANDVKIAAKAYETDFPKLAQMGIKIYEYQGPKTLHVKNVLVDGQRGYVGSYNLDPRSENLNMELGVIYDSSTLARAHSKQIRNDILSSKLVAKNGKALVKKKKRWFFNNILLPIIRPQL